MIKSLDGIRILAQSDKSQQEFCDDFLREIADVVGADAGIIWNASTHQFKVVSQYSLEEKPARLNLTRVDHDRLLGDAANRDTPILVRSGEQEVQQDSPMLFVGKFHRDGRHLIELMVQPNDDSEEDVKQMMQQFGVALKTVDNPADGNHPLQEVPETPVDTGIRRSFNDDELSSYLSAIHHSIDLKLTAANVANETRRLLDCDRVSVVIYHRGRFRVFAISGQPSVNRRSNTTRLLEKLSRRLLKTGQSFWYPEETELPSQVSEVLDEYLAISATRSLVVMPVYEKVPSVVEDPDSLESKQNRTIGGIVFEHCHQRWKREEVESVINLTTDHGGNAIRNANQHRSLFLYPLWNLLGKSKLLTAPRMLSKTILATLAVIAITLFLVFFQVDFYVSADGILMPETHKPVFSSVEGRVDQLFVEHGSVVNKNDTLATMSSDEHDYRVRELTSQLESAEQRLTSIQDRRFTEQDDKEAIEENIVSLKTQIKNLEAQLAILNKISSSMVIKSPIDGQIITWDLKRRLQNRVVDNGIQLVEVANIDGEWILEIELPVRREGHISREIARRGDAGLAVSFLLAADTSKRYAGRVIEVEKNVALNANKEQVIKIRAAIEGDDISIDQVRTSVTAKIYCGRTSIGYQWLHDVGEFFQKYVFFKFR
ncbi:MAG: HlyD family efflux transporter periplasmic adaptor subunit [Planctomycetota bacterium]